MEANHYLNEHLVNAKGQTANHQDILNENTQATWHYDLERGEPIIPYMGMADWSQGRGFCIIQYLKLANLINILAKGLLITKWCYIRHVGGRFHVLVEGL